MAYIGKSPTGTGVRSRFYFTATGGETSLSGTDDNNATLVFADGAYVDVYLNGVLLVAGTDYNTSTANTIAGLTALAANDIVEILVFDIFTVADTVSASSGGTFSGNVTMTANLSVDGGTIKLDGNHPTGTGNVALGDGALDDASLSGGFNTAIGSAALGANTTGTQNTAMGQNALDANTTGNNNIAVGSHVLGATTTGSNNTGIGKDALFNNTTASNNTAVGYYALVANTTGSLNTAVGGNALDANTTGLANTAVGQNSLGANTTGSQNTAVGMDAMQVNTTGNYNAVLGRDAMEANTTGSNNTAVGWQSLLSNTTASFNTAVGYQAGRTNTTGQVNTYLGYNAGRLNSTGGSNTGIGTSALENNTASNNTAIGKDALVSNTTGTENVAVGYLSLDANTTASNNVGVGRHTLGSTTTGGGNTAVGDAAGISNQTGTLNTYIGADAGSVATGSSNTFVGRYAGGTVTTGAKNTIIGRYNGNQGGLDNRTASNNIVLSDGDGNPRMYFDSNGSAYLRGAGSLPWSTSSGGWKFSSASPYGMEWLNSRPSSATGTQNVLVNYHNGTYIGGINTSTTATSFPTSSDYRLKENVVDLIGATDRVKQLAPKRFNFIAEPNEICDGFLAHEVSSVVPQAVFGEKDAVNADGNPEYQGIDQSKLVPLLTAALQEALTKIDDLEARIAALESS